MMERNDVAVIGMSCRFPEADNVDEFWSNLISGKNSVRPPPKERWYIKGGQEAFAGYLKCPLDEFDANFFNISPKEAPYIDPQHRLFMEVSWESLENAGIPPTSLNGSKTGVYLGIGSDEYFRTQLDTTEDTIYKVVGNTISAATGRLSFFLNLHGPSVPLEATCASSAVAVHLACLGLQRGDCTLSLAGGVNIIIETSNSYPSALTSQSCRSFDSSASGFAPAEGCGVLVLKLLKDAVRDGNEILGVIRGSSLNHTGKSTSYGTPNTIREEEVIRDGLKFAGVDPLDVTYLEAHAGGTPIGDPIEVRAISNVFGDSKRDKPLILGAFKTNIGHPLSAAGVAGIMKMLLCIKHRTVPQNLHLNELHPDINLKDIPALVPAAPIPWESSRPLIGAVNCFGITGSNVHLVIEEPPPPTPVSSYNASNPSLSLLTISAKDEVALEKLREKYKEAIDRAVQEDDKTLADFAYSANTGRSHLSHRTAILGSSFQEMSQKLGTLDFISGVVPSSHQPIVFLFTGHGCHYFGMAKELYTTSHVFRAAFDECNVMYRNNLGISLQEFLWTPGYDLNRTKYSQPAIFSIEYCLYKLWTSLGVKPDIVLGHSIGEFAACVASGILSFEDGMKLVCSRSLLVDGLAEGRMIAIEASIPNVTSMIADFQKENPGTWLDIACMNSVHQTVVSTEVETASKFKEFIEKSAPGVRSKVLASQHGFHGRGMDPILDDFERVASELKTNEPRCKYISGLMHKEMEGRELNGAYWRNHCRNMVSFSMGVDYLLQKGCKVFVEVSPQPTLLNFLIANNTTGAELVTCPSLRKNQENWTTLLNSTAKIYANTDADIQFQNIYSGKRVQVPTYAFNRKKCWASTSAKGSRGLGGGPAHEKMFHSLLGWKLNLAMSNEIRFYNYLSSTSTGYVHDHVIVDHIIIPAACYLEMVLFLARHEFGIQFPVIENFQVLQACVLDERMKQMQTKVEYEGSNLSVAVFSESDGIWLQHLEATINMEAKVEAPQALLAHELEQIHVECNHVIDMQDMYRRLNVSGISLGPLLRGTGSIHHNYDTSQILAKLYTVKTKEGEFQCHPITLDNLVQVFWEYQMLGREDTPFALPVGINKFTWYGEDNASLPGTIYFHIKDLNNSQVFTPDGKILAEWNTLTVLQSTTSAFLKSIAAVENLPQFMSKDWVPVKTPQNEIEMNAVLNLSPEEIEEEINFIIEIQKEGSPIEQNYAQLSFLYILEALLELDWKPSLGVPFTIDSIVQPNAPLVDSRAHLSFMRILEEEGLLKRTGNQEWTLVKELPSIEQVKQMRAEIDFKSEQESLDYEYITHLGESLPSVLKGQLDPLDALFSNNKVSVTRMYSESKRCVFDRDLLSRSLRKILQKSLPAISGKKLRIIEIGAGSGSATSVVLSILDELEIPFDYTFTDIGTSFLHEGKKKFAKHGKDMTFKVLDIEKDPKVQGFTPHSYDIVIALQVLHATEDLQATLEHTHHLLVPDGYFFLNEAIGDYRDFTFSFFLLKSYWRMKDFRTQVIVDASAWMDLLNNTGFKDIVNLTIPECLRGLFLARASSSLRPFRPALPTLSTSDPAWIIFGNKGSQLHEKLGENLKRVGRNAFYVIEAARFDKFGDCFGLNPKRTSDFQQLSHVLKNYTIEGLIYLWGMTAKQQKLEITTTLKKVEETITGGFLNVLKMRINNSWTSKLFLVTEGVEEINPAQGTLWGMLDTFLNEYPEACGLGIDIDKLEDEEKTANSIFNYLWDVPNERGINLKNGVWEVGRVHDYDSSLPLDEVTVPRGGKFKLLDAETFKFGPAQPPPELMEVSVRAVGLNFRDLLLSSSLLETSHPDSVGLEFGGVVTQLGNLPSGFEVGDRIAGLTCTGALASHISIDNPNLIFKIPPGMSFAGAATLPVAYGTCYLSMVNVAAIKPGERVLIHTGSGGLGLAGIQLARHLGAEIFVTAGSEKKRKYLRECLGVTHVYNSRTKDYEAQILSDTNGAGIDVVLNTLTGPGFKEATLKCTAQKGRFIELSKLNVWTPSEVQELRPDVQYTILDAFDMILNSHPSLTTALAELTKLFSKGILDVLPHTFYPLAQVRSAFKYFHGHTHIGKVVVEVPESFEKLSVLSLFNPESTYMVTGGIGGLGFEVGKYIWENNGNVLLVGRSKASEEMEEKIESYGERMQYVQCDVGDFDQCKELLNSISPPLRGIFHCAGVFANAFIVGQSNENYAKSFQSKIYGTWNLHSLTKDKHLDHFVLYSSVAAIIGSTGLSNYSAGNRYLDSLAHYRVNQCGLPALTIDWGPWSEVGTAAGYVSGMFKNFFHFSPQLGIQSMERAMRLRLHDIVIADMDSNIASGAPKLAPFISELTFNTGQKTKRKGSRDGIMNRPSDIMINNLAKEVREADSSDRLEKMEAFVEAVFKTQSGLGEMDKVDRDQQLTLMGMDSLIGMEMRLRISKALDVSIPANAVLEHNSIKKFSAYLSGLITPEGLEPEPVKLPETHAEDKKDRIGTEEEELLLNKDSASSDASKKHEKNSRKSNLPKFVAKRLQKYNSKKEMKHSGTSG